MNKTFICEFVRTGYSGDLQEAKYVMGAASKDEALQKALKINHYKEQDKPSNWTITEFDPNVDDILEVHEFRS